MLNLGGIKRGWHTAKIGGGGLITGIDIAPDGTIVVRADVSPAYIWTGTVDSIDNPFHKWEIANSLRSLKDVPDAVIPAQPVFGNPAAYEFVIAHSNTRRLAMMTGDITVQGGDVWSAVYITDDRCQTWRRINDDVNFPSFKDAQPNSTPNKNYARKMVFDPNNADILYIGAPLDSELDWPVYRTFDNGATVDGSWCDGVISPATQDVGVACMMFDIAHGTVEVEGQTRTARMLLPVSGVGVYETWDGGETWTLTTDGPPQNHYQAGMDFDGTYYVSALITGGKLWRYIKGASQGNGTWADLSTASGWPAFAIDPQAFSVDPRDGSQGKVWMTYSSDPFHGQQSTNANAADPDDVTWSGTQGSPTGQISIADHDVLWLRKSRVVQAGTAFHRCDHNGTVWWAGAQGLWRNSSLVYQSGVPVVATGTCRGMEETVTAAACRPPGSPNTLFGLQDIFCITTPDLDEYPTLRYPNADQFAQRGDCTSIDWAPNNPAFIVVRCGRELRPGNEAGSHWSGYSSNYGASFTPYGVQPDPLYGANGTTGGQIIAFDEDRHLCLPGVYVTGHKPAFSHNARAGTPTWTLCSDLPDVVWLSGAGFGFQRISTPLAVDYVTPGRAYLWNHNNGELWRTDDYAENWSVVGTRTLAASFSTSFLKSVPGHAGHLWLTGLFTGGVSPKIYRSTDAGETWTDSGITIPGDGYPMNLALGATVAGASYPTIFLMTWNAYFTQWEFYRSTDEGTNWTLVGQNPTSIPKVTQLDFFKVLAGDWVEPGRFFYGTGGSGFSYCQT